LAVLSTVANVATPGLPVGSIQAFAGANAPTGWLLCDGSAVSRGDYSDLFSTIGTSYGSGNGATTFNLPDLRGRVPAGKDNMGGTAANRLTSSYFGGTATNLGASGGSESHQLTEAQLASHTHTQNAHSHSVESPGGHSWGANFGGLSGGATFTFSPSGVWAGVYGGQNLTAMGVTATNQNTGGNGAHNNTQPTLIVNYIIKAVADIARGGWYNNSSPPVVTQLPLNPAYGETALLSTGGTALVYYWYSGSNWQQVSGVAQPTGSVIQTVVTRMDTRTTFASSNTGNGNTITGLNLTITPRFSNSRIICEWTINGELHQDNVFLIHKDGSLVSDGYNTVLGNSRWSGMMSGFYDQNEDSTPSNWKLTYVDSSLGSTNARTYAPAIRSSSGGNFTLAVNRTLNGATQDAYESMVSYGIAMEIAQ